MALSDFKTIPETLERFRITYTTKDFVHIEEIPGTLPNSFCKNLNFAYRILMFLHRRRPAAKPLSFLF